MILFKESAKEEGLVCRTDSTPLTLRALIARREEPIDPLLLTRTCGTIVNAACRQTVAKIRQNQRAINEDADLANKIALAVAAPLTVSARTVLSNMAHRTKVPAARSCRQLG